MEAIETILTRRSVRKFTDEKISDEEIKKLLEAAFAAPSGMNAQPWHFVVVKSEENLKKVRDLMMFGKYECPIIIIPCVNNGKALPFRAHNLAYCDLGAATENILLAAHALGLGAVWCAIYPDENKSNKIAKELGLKSNIKPYSAIYIGHISPDDKGQIKNKFNESKFEII